MCPTVLDNIEWYSQWDQIGQGQIYAFAKAIGAQSYLCVQTVRMLPSKTPRASTLVKYKI